MALDSLGLGLTLDTTLLEKADKTILNMVKNSQMIMQNLTRGFTAFNEGKISDFGDVISNIVESIGKLQNAKVSPDFDTNGLNKYTDRMLNLLEIIEKMSKTEGNKFYDPTEVYATNKRPSEILKEIENLAEFKKTLQENIATLSDFDNIQNKLRETLKGQGTDLINQQRDVDNLTATYNATKEAIKALQEQYEKFSAAQLHKNPFYSKSYISSKFLETDAGKSSTKLLLELTENAEKLKESIEKANDILNITKGNMMETMQTIDENEEMKLRENAIQSAYDNIKEQEKILNAELKYANATSAEKAAMLTKRNKAEQKLEKERVDNIKKTYEELRREILAGERRIAELESSRDTLIGARKSTSSIDAQLSEEYKLLEQRMSMEEEFAKSNYPEIAEIKAKYENDAFIKASKERAKRAEAEQKKNLSNANLYSRNAQTIEEEREAIVLLTTARDNLNKSTERYSTIIAAINKRILAHKDHIESVTRLEKEQNTLSDSVINRYRKQLKALDEVNAALDELYSRQASTGIITPDDDANEKALLARRTTIQKDLVSIEKQTQGQLDVVKEQHEADRSRKAISEATKRSEQEKKEYAKLLDELDSIRDKKRTMYELEGDNTITYQELVARERGINNRLTEIRKNHLNDLADIEQEHNKKVNDEAVKEFVSAQKKKIEEAEKYGKLSKSEALFKISDSEQAENVAQHRKAIEELQKVKSKLDNTDKDYYKTLKKLNNAIHSHELYVRAADTQSRTLLKTHRGLLDIGGQLMRRFALVFSVSQLTQYFRKLVEIRGEFEKTEVALTSIIGDNQKAEKLMNQTIALAIKSPFTLKQLVSYTKQLAAYQVSYKELHSTTKMLADVSAGLGVEMDRLILAFGQVKAANYLRATEVRQFTEAGFNILGELAKYYGELEQRIISVGEVQEMVTKRMVSFEDVAEVIRRVTSEGGMFFDMQSKQAETLAGQWTNLIDRIDVMFNEIGKSQMVFSTAEDFLKGFVKVLANAIDNWEVLASVLKTAVGAFILVKIQAMLAGDSLKLMAINTGILTGTVPKVLTLRQAWAALGRTVVSSVKGMGASLSSIKINPWLIAMAAAMELVSAAVTHFKKLNSSLKENADAFNENVAAVNKLSKEYKTLDSFNKKLEKLKELGEKLGEKGLELSVKIGEVNTDNIDSIFTENEERLQRANEFGKAIGDAITRGVNAAQGNIFGFSTLGENLQEDAEDFAQAWAKLASYKMGEQISAMENELLANEKAGKASRKAMELYQQIAEGRKAERNESGRIVKYLETEYEWTLRRAKTLLEIQNLYDGSVTRSTKLQSAMRGVNKATYELSHETDKVFKNIAEAYGGMTKLKKEAKDNPLEMIAAIDAEIDKQSWDEVTKWVQKQDFYARLNLTPQIVGGEEALQKEYSGFKKDLMDARKRLELGGNKYENFFISQEEIDKMSYFSDGIESIQKLYDENAKTLKELNGTRAEYNKEEVDRLNALQSELLKVAKLWGYTFTSKKNGGENEALKRLKEQIRLIKEANKAYEERNKKFSKKESMRDVFDFYKDTFSKAGLDIKKIDYTSIDGVVKALEELERKAKAAGGELELLKEISEVKVKLRINTQDLIDNKLFDEIQKNFDNYNLSLELKQLNIPKSLAKTFGIDYKTLKGLKQEIIDKFSEGIGEGSAELIKELNKEFTTIDWDIVKQLTSEDQMKKIKEFFNKINDLEANDAKERMKTYSKYLIKGLNERVRLKVEELQELKKIEEASEFTEEQKARIKRGISKEAREKQNKQEWEEFKASNMYTMMFDDLEYMGTKALEVLKSKLNDLKLTLKDLPANELKEVIEQINKIEDIQIARAPFKSYREALNEIKKLNPQGISEEEIQRNYAEAELKKQSYQEELDAITLILGAKERGLDLTQQSAEWQKKYGLYLSMDNQQLEEAELSLSAMVMGQENVVSLAAKQLQAYANARQALDGVRNKWEGIRDAASQAYENIKGVIEAFGVDTDSIGMEIADASMSMLDLVFQAIMFSQQQKIMIAQATELNVAMNAALGPIGWTLLAIQGIATVIKTIVSARDKKLKKQVDEQLDQVEMLQKRYENIEEAIDNAWNTASIQAYNAQLQTTMNSAIAAQKQAIAAQEKRKGANKKGSDVYNELQDMKEELANMEKQLAESLENSFSKVTDGILDSTLDAAKQATDAWYESFKETKKGIDGLEDNFDDMFKSLAKNQAAMQITGAFVEQWKNELSKYINANDTRLTTEEARKWAESVRDTFPELDEALRAYFDAIGDVIGVDSNGLSGLEKGIQGMSEETAQVLASYWNSVRQYTANIDAKFDILLSKLNMSSEENPILTQLISQTKILSNIYNFLNSMTTSSSTRSGFMGRAFKTAM